MTEIEILERRIADNAEDAESIYQLAVLLEDELIRDPQRQDEDYWNKALTRIRTLLTRAITLDPKHAKAHAHLAHTLSMLLEFEQSGVPGSQSPSAVTAARLRGQEYLLERRLFRRRSTGELIARDRKSGAEWSRFAFPAWWHYDVLRGLDYLRRAKALPDERVAEAIALVASKRDEGGRWPLETQYPGRM